MKERMKRHIIIFLALMLPLLSSCIEETLPKGGTQTESQIAMSEETIVAMAHAIPGAMTNMNAAGYVGKYGVQNDFGLPAVHLMTESMLEDLAVGGEPGYFPFYWYAMNEYQDDEHIYCAYFWDAYYWWIALANEVIAKVSAPQSEELQAALGMAYMYRAMCYFDLARLYEPKENNYTDVSAVLGLTVPIVTEKTTVEELQNNPRQPREKLYQFVLDDLAMAEKLFEKQVHTYSFPSLPAIYGLYARIYLEMGYWEEGSEESFKKAAEYARKAITKSGCRPLTQTEWEDPINGFNNGGANSSWIWGLTLDPSNTNNLCNFTAMFSSEALWGYPCLYNPCASIRFYDSIDDADFRKHSWIDPAFFTGGGSYNYKLAGSADEQRMFLYGDYNLQINAAIPYQSIKFRPAGGAPLDDINGGCADHPVMRVEEMMFIEMEAKAGLGEISEAKDLLNEFMEYRITDGSYDCSKITSTSDFLTEMLFQKRVEFWGEGVLFYDYKRLNKGITRKYSGSNHPAVWSFNSKGRSPQWNIVIPRNEHQNNDAITEELNNPDPSKLLKL